MTRRVAASLAIALLVGVWHVEASAQKTTTLLGTWIWDVESNQFGREGDFWWQYATSTEAYLTPQRGAEAALVLDRPFERIDAAAARQMKLSRDRITRASLLPGAVVVFRTRKGRLGKLQVVSYKSSHDFAFPEAANLGDSWRKFARGRPEIPSYHMQVRWMLLD